MWHGKIQLIWTVIAFLNIKLCKASGKLSIQFLRLKNNKKLNNDECCDNVFVCLDECDIYLDICVTEVSQPKCSAENFVTKVLAEGSFTFPGIGGDLGKGRKNPLEYSFQKWQGFTLAIEIWDYDSGFLKGSSDFVDNIHLDISDSPSPNYRLASSKAHRMKSKSSPNERYLDLQLKVYCDDNYLVPDCARKCIPRDDAQGHYTCDYVKGRVVCNQYWYGDRCTKYCKPRNDTQGHYTCDKFGAKICASSWFGGNCSAFCKNTDDARGHYKCDALTGRKICLANWYGKDCLVFCKAQDKRDGHYSCNKTSGEKACLKDWYGTECTKLCLAQNDKLLGHFKCDINGDKVCSPGWHGVNCTQEIIPTTMAKISSIIQPSYYIKTSLSSKNAPTQMLSGTSQAGRSTSTPKPRTKPATSIVINSSSSKNNELDLTFTIYSETVVTNSKNETTSFTRAYLANSTSMTKEMYSFRITSTTSHYNENARALVSSKFGSSAISSFGKKTSTRKDETISQNKPSPKTSVFLSTEKRSRVAISQTIAHPNTSQKARNTLRMDTHSHIVPREYEQSIYESTSRKQSVKVSLKETLSVSHSMMMSKTQQEPSNSIKVSSRNFTFRLQTLTDTFYTKASATNVSSLFDKKTVTSSKSKVAIRTEPIMSSQSLTTANISGAMTESSPVLPTKSVVMTSSKTIATNETRKETMTFIVKLYQDKLQDDFKRKLAERIKEMNRNSKDVKFKEVNVRKIEQCKNTVLLAIDLSYNYENDHKLANTEHVIKAILERQLNAMDITLRQGSEHIWKCRASQSTSSAPKRDNFVVVFLPIVVFMMALGLALCIKIKHKKRRPNKVVPVNHLLSTKVKTDDRAPQILITSHGCSQQELLEMSDFTTTATLSLVSIGSSD